MYCMQLTITVIAIIAGVLIAWKPRKAIDIQIAFYRLINWKLEPISMEKEIKEYAHNGCDTPCRWHPYVHICIFVLKSQSFDEIYSY
jgi:hypothetical protein